MTTAALAVVLLVIVAVQAVRRHGGPVAAVCAVMLGVLITMSAGPLAAATKGAADGVRTVIATTASVLFNSGQDHGK